jgi:glycosyltransferase involved in cell wall biosynthesis
MSSNQRLPFSHQIYYYTRPDFLKHDHIHKRRTEALRAAGLHASALSFVPKLMYQARRPEYERAQSDGLRRVVQARDAGAVNSLALRFLRLRLLRFRRLLVHVLLCDPAPVLQLKQWPFLGRRVKCVIEHEGDIPSEWLYRWTYAKYNPPSDEPPPEHKAAYDSLVREQAQQLQQADGAILVTQEHRALWERRLGRRLDALVLPTFFDPAPFSFSAASRERLRAELELTDKVVLVYSGSVNLEWQRFECVCQLVAMLCQRGHPAHLLALVHPDGHAHAQGQIEQHGLSATSHLLAVQPEAMGAYLSAADLALFLRHKHIMNRIVTSAKLGEYIAAGLPVLTTWACPYYRSFVEQHSAALEIPDSLELGPGFENPFAELTAKAKDPAWRGELSRAFRSAFAGENDSLQSYVQFMRQQLR